jgi:hypothetical protein
MNRRDVMRYIGGAFTAPFVWPLAVAAQEPGRIYRIGFLILPIPSVKL